MRSFEERFAAVGAAIDRAIERLRERRPRRFVGRRGGGGMGGPSLRERAAEGVRGAREFVVEKKWKDLSLVDERSRRRVKVLACVLGASVLVAVPVWIVRGRGSQPSMQELMDQAMVKARMELASRAGGEGAEGGSGNGGAGTMGSWGAGPGAGAVLQGDEGGGRRWGP